MNNYEIKQRIRMLRDIRLIDMQYMTATFIDMCLVNDPVFKEMHQDTGIKPYNFGLVLPIEPDKIYYAGKEYTFTIRTYNNKLKNFLQNNLAFFNGFDAMLGVGSSIELLDIDKNNFTVKTTTATDVDFTVRNVKVLNRLNMKDAKDYIQRNIRKKYHKIFRNVYDENALDNVDFIESIESNGCIHTTLEHTTFTCDRYIITFKNTKEGELARETALLLGVGLKNARGFGFCVQVKSSINKGGANK